MSTEKKPLSYQQLKETINNLTPEQLEMPVRWWGEERGGAVYFASPIGEEYILTDEGYEPVKCFDAEELEELADAPRLASNTVILSVD